MQHPYVVPDLYRVDHAKGVSTIGQRYLKYPRPEAGQRFDDIRLGFLGRDG
jgi:hypothetical protein